jgi:hypothetical protein
VRFGHANGQDALSRDDFRQDARADGIGRVGRDDAGLDAGLAEGRHRGDIASLRNLLEHQRRIEYRQAKTAIFFGHRHAEHTDLGELLMLAQGNVPSMYFCAFALNSPWASSRTAATIRRCCSVSWKSIVCPLRLSLAVKRP